MRKGMYILPSLFTTANIAAGFFAILETTRAAAAEPWHFDYAAMAIGFAVFFDGLDGRIARLLKSTSSFGAELDSLSDFVSFGVAPAAVLYLWTMSTLHGLGWAIVLFYAVCCALRLARFNAEAGRDRPAYASPFFSGVPAPLGATQARTKVLQGMGGVISSSAEMMTGR